MSSSPLYEVGKLRCLVLEGNLLELDTANSLAGNRMIFLISADLAQEYLFHLIFSFWEPFDCEPHPA